MPRISKTKVCCDCERRKPLSEFSRNTITRHKIVFGRPEITKIPGYRPECKPCSRKRRKDYSLARRRAAAVLHAEFQTEERP